MTIERIRAFYLLSLSFGIICIPFSILSQIDYTKLPVHPDEWILDFLLVDNIDSIVVKSTDIKKNKSLSTYVFGKSNHLRSFKTIVYNDSCAPSKNEFVFEGNRNDSVTVLNSFSVCGKTKVKSFYKTYSYDSINGLFLVQNIYSNVIYGSSLKKVSDNDILINLNPQDKAVELQFSEDNLLQRMSSSEVNQGQYYLFSWSKNRCKALTINSSSLENYSIVPKYGKKAMIFFSEQNSDFEAVTKYKFDRKRRIKKIITYSLIDTFLLKSKVSFHYYQ